MRLLSVLRSFFSVLVGVRLHLLEGLSRVAQLIVTNA